MFHEIETPDAELSPRQQLVQQELIAFGKRMKSIDDNAAKIDECNLLSALLRGRGGITNTGHPVVCVHETSVGAWVQIGNRKLSTIRAAIRDAGLHIYSEIPRLAIDSPIGAAYVSEIEFTLVGYDCPVLALDIADEFSDLAAAA